MSKDQKKIKKMNVEMVEKVDFILNWITSTITFWDLSDKWPTNLIQKSVDELIKELRPYWDDPLS